MQELKSLLELIVDIFCFSISTNKESIIEIPQYVPLLVCIFGVVLFVFSVAQKFINAHFKENKFIPYLFAILVIALSFGTISGNEYNFIFNVFYIPLIMALRALEGGLISTSLRPRKWLWISIPIIIVLTVIYFLLHENNVLIYFTIIWSLIGITIASYKWVMVMKKNNLFSLNNLSFISIFIIFLGSMLFIPSTKTDQIFHLIMLPVGFTVGLMSKAKWVESKLNKIISTYEK